MIFEYCIDNLIFEVDNSTKLEYTSIDDYNLIFIVKPNESQVQLIIINENIKINLLNIKENKIIITYSSNQIINMKHKICWTKITFFSSNSLILDCLADENDETFYDPYLQPLLNKFKSKDLVKLLLESDEEFKKSTEHLGIEYIQIIDPSYSETSSIEEEIIETETSDSEYF